MPVPCTVKRNIQGKNEVWEFFFTMRRILKLMLFACYVKAM